MTDPLEIIDNVIERVRSRLDGRELRATAPAAVPAIVADPLLLEQALINVIDNALVHTPPECAIQVGADYSDDSVRIWVEDNGPGVDKPDLEYIFDKFHRVKTTESAPGVGLGLAISKGFVEAMKGKVTASTPAPSSRGLRIEFAFPAIAQLERA